MGSLIVGRIGLVQYALSAVKATFSLTGQAATLTAAIVSAWILAAGAWSDSGAWADSANWNDS